MVADSIKEVMQPNDTLIVSSEKYEMTIHKRDRHYGNFLFLNFWTGMDSVEYVIIRDSLLRHDVISRSSNNSSTLFKISVAKNYNEPDQIVEQCFNLYPNFEFGKLFQMSLYLTNCSENETNYDYVDNIIRLYTSRYGIPTKEVRDPINYETAKVIGKDPENDNKYYSEYITKSYYRYESYSWQLTNNKIVIEIEHDDKKSITTSAYLGKEIRFVEITSLTIKYTDQQHLNKKANEAEREKQKRLEEIDNSLNSI